MANRIARGLISGGGEQNEKRANFLLRQSVAINLRGKVAKALSRSDRRRCQKAQLDKSISSSPRVG
jgi:hypothetical protein